MTLASLHRLGPLIERPNRQQKGKIEQAAMLYLTCTFLTRTNRIEHNGVLCLLCFKLALNEFSFGKVTTCRKLQWW